MLREERDRQTGISNLCALFGVNNISYSLFIISIVEDRPPIIALEAVKVHIFDLRQILHFNAPHSDVIEVGMEGRKEGRVVYADREPPISLGRAKGRVAGVTVNGLIEPACLPSWLAKTHFVV